MAKRVILDLDLDYLSGVDLPAQEPATVRAMKGAPGAESDKTMKTAEQLQAEIVELNKKLERAEKRATMTDAHKAFVKTLIGDDEREAFVSKSVADRDKQMKEAQDADPVVYESKRLGKSWRKSQQDLADAMKELDDQHVEKAAVVETARKERVAKRVSSLNHLSDDEGGLTFIVDAIDKCQDEKVKKAANQALDGLNKAAELEQGAHGTRQTRKGATGPTGEADTAKKAFDDYVAEVATKKGISHAEAHVHCATIDAKGKKLNKAWKDAARAAQAN